MPHNGNELFNNMNAAYSIRRALPLEWPRFEFPLTLTAQGRAAGAVNRE
jgi:hypothetical protein